MNYSKIENNKVVNYGNLKQLGDYKNYLSFWKHPVAIHNKENFFKVNRPEITATQRLLPLLPSSLKNKEFTHRIEDFTQEEIDTKDLQDAENALNSDTSSQFFENRKMLGTELIDKFNKHIYRKHVVEGVSLPQVLKALETFFDALLPLSQGLFELSIKRLNALELPNQQLIDLKDEAILKIEAIKNEF